MSKFNSAAVPQPNIGLISSKTTVTPLQVQPS